MDLLESIHTTLQLHDTPSHIAGQRVHLTGRDLAFEPRVFDGPPAKQSTIVQLDIIAYSERIAPHHINESIAGMGSDKAAAVRDALGKFLLGPFHVILTALADHSCENNPADWEHWSGPHGDWRICQGSLLLVGPKPAPEVYAGFLEHLQSAFLSSMTPRPHWVRVYVGSFERRACGVEVLLDNEPWPPALAIAEKWQWDCPEEYRSLRHFFIALPEANATVPSDPGSRNVWSRLKRSMRGAR